GRPTPQAGTGPLPPTQLLDNDSPLPVYLVAFERNIMRPVVQNQQTGIHDGFTYERYVGYIITGVLPCREGIQVVPELHAYPFAPLRQLLIGKMLCPVE